MHNEKPKRKRGGTRPRVYIAVGVLIGALVSGAIAAVLLFTVRVQPLPMPTGTALMPAPSLIPTVTPFTQSPGTLPAQNAPQAQPTVIASFVSALAVAPTGPMFAVAVWDEADLDGDGFSEVGAIVEVRRPRVVNNLSSEARRVLTASDFIDTLVFSQDGGLLVAGSSANPNNQIYIVDVGTGETLQTLTGQATAAFSPDGQTLALAGINGGVRLLNAQTLDFQRALNLEQATPIFKLAFAPDSRHLATTTFLDGRTVVHIYDLQNPDAAPEQYGADLRVNDLAFHPNGRLLALATGDDIIVVNREDASYRYLPFEARQTMALAFSPDGGWLAVAGGDSGIGTAQLAVWQWDAGADAPVQGSARQQPMTLVGHHHLVTDVAFMPHLANQLLSVGRDGSVRLWDVANGVQLSRLQL